jgi:hypothetical protein
MVALPRVLLLITRSTRATINIEALSPRPDLSPPLRARLTHDAGAFKLGMAPL